MERHFENMKHAFHSGLMENAKQKARERMCIIGKKYAKVNGERLSKYFRHTKGGVMRPLVINE
jgi:hypothetical protein